MRAALLTLKEYPVRGRRVAVLGDMFELGAITRQAHAEVGALAARCGVDLLLTVGGAMRTGRESAAALGANAVHCQPRHGVRDDSGRVLQSRAQGLKAAPHNSWLTP